MRRPTRSTSPRHNNGIVLPIALIMLVIISFAGLIAARNSATYTQFSSNMRTNQVARVSAEDALRYCERVAIDSVEDEPSYEDADKIVTTEITGDSDSDFESGEWNKKSSWKEDSQILITVPLTFGAKVKGGEEESEEESLGNPRLKNPPTCVIQAMVNDRFLITSRGLSSDATFNEDDGSLKTGSEVWLQSILTEKVPTYCSTGVVCN
jgi:Tfp pilus assembly protein PilX